MAGGPLGQLGRQLDPLGFATRERGGRLAESHVSQPHVDERLHVAGDRRLIGEECQGLLARQVEDVGDREPLEQDFERVAVVTRALAHVARHVHVGKEVHLDLDRAVTGARLAATALDVEAEAPGQVAAHLRLRRLGEELAHVVEHTGVRGRVGPRGAADRRLVDVDDLVEVFEPGDLLVVAGRDLRAVDLLHQ